jgi:hypothetical protein
MSAESSKLCLLDSATAFWSNCRVLAWASNLHCEDLLGGFNIFGAVDLGHDFRKCEIDLDFEFFLVDFLLETEIGDCSLLIGLDHKRQFGGL